MRNVALVLALSITIMSGLVGSAFAHYPNAIIYSSQATAVPTIDGRYDPVPGEWGDATLVDLTALNPQPLEAYGYFKHDANFLYILIDVVDDTTDDEHDESNIDFDTGHDLHKSNGAEDEFLIEGDGGTEHYVYNDPDWQIHCDPFNTGLPLHAGLAAAAGMSSSPNSAGVHRVYEFQIPLALIQVSPGDTIGFGMGAEIFYGIYDDEGDGGDNLSLELQQDEEGVGNCWPTSGYEGGFEIDDYGNLVLGSRPVGGTAIPVNKLAVLTPYLTLIGLVGAVTVAVAVQRRRKP